MESRSSLQRSRIMRIRMSRPSEVLWNSRAPRFPVCEITNPASRTVLGRPEQQHPNDAEGALRYWAFYQQGRTIDPFDPDRLLSRSAAELSGEHPKDPLLVEIEQYWKAERRRLVRLCKAANLREPGDLADKLLLLIHGLRNERGAFGHRAPSRLLPKVADDLMVTHGATRKPLLAWTED